MKKQNGFWIIYLVWEIPTLSSGLINLRAICSAKKKAKLYKYMLERDLQSFRKGEVSIFIEERYLNHLYGYSMLDSVINMKLRV